jgi:hypothetical protein
MEEGCQKSRRLSYTAKFKREVIQCAEEKETAKPLQDNIAWEDDVEDKDDSDWVESTDIDSVMSDDSESDE